MEYAQKQASCARKVLFMEIFLQILKNYSYLCTTKRKKSD